MPRFGRPARPGGPGVHRRRRRHAGPDCATRRRAGRRLGSSRAATAPCAPERTGAGGGAGVGHRFAAGVPARVRGRRLPGPHRRGRRRPRLPRRRDRDGGVGAQLPGAAGRPPRPRRVGRRDHRRHRGARAGPGRVGRLHENSWPAVPFALPRPGGQHPSGAAAVVSRRARGARERWPTASRSPAARCTWWTRAPTPGRSWPSRPVPVLDDDDEATLHERIKVVERRLLVDVLAALATRRRDLDWTKGDHRMTRGHRRAQADPTGVDQRVRQDRSGRTGPGSARGGRRHRLDRFDRENHCRHRCSGDTGGGGHRLPRGARRPGQDPAPARPRRPAGRPPQTRARCRRWRSSVSSRSISWW